MFMAIQLLIASVLHTTRTCNYCFSASTWLVYMLEIHLASTVKLHTYEKFYFMKHHNFPIHHPHILQFIKQWLQIHITRFLAILDPEWVEASQTMVASYTSIEANCRWQRSLAYIMICIVKWVKYSLITILHSIIQIWKHDTLLKDKETLLMKHCKFPSIINQQIL